MPMQSVAEEWTEYKTRHFLIFYDKAPIEFVQAIETAAERFLEDIYADMRFGRPRGWTYDERVKIYIYNDQDDYVNERNVAWSHGAASPTKKIIRTFPTAHGFFDSTLPHELGHIIFRDFVGYRVSLPLWFEEGVAMYQEQAKRFGSHAAVREAIEQDLFIPLKELQRMRLYSDTDRSIIALFYAESASIVNYLITEHGKHRFIRFCRKLKEGKSFEAALSNVYVRFKDLDKLNKAWVKYVMDY